MTTEEWLAEHGDDHMLRRSRRRTAILLVLLLVVGVAYAFIMAVPAGAVPSSEAQYEAWTYALPVEPDTQSGAPFLDAQGRVFSVVRDDARLKVYRDDVLVLQEADAYGAPFGQIRPQDGCLYVSALDNRNRRLWRVYRVPSFACVSFISRAASVPMVVR